MNDEQGPALGPEPLPEPGPVSVPAAAQALGISERAVRKRIHAGTLRAQPFGRSFMVWLSGNVPGPGPEPGPEPIEAAYRVTPVEVEQAIERTGAKYIADMASLYDRISTELGKVYEGQLVAKDQTIATQAETIADLRRRADATEAERARLAAAQVTQDAPAGPGAHEAIEAKDNTPAGLWARLRRAWRGA